MVALLFLLFFLAAVFILRDERKLALQIFVIAFGLSLYWFHFHTTSALRILL